MIKKKLKVLIYFLLDFKINFEMKMYGNEEVENIGVWIIFVF